MNYEFFNVIIGCVVLIKTLGLYCNSFFTITSYIAFIHYKIKIDNEFTRPGYNKSNQIPEFKSNDNRTFKLVNDRRRNLDHSEYINIGSMTNTGFGNISDFSKIKYGTSTRDIDGTYRDRELDRFHFTYRNFQHELYGSNAIPQDTRYLNKKF